MDLSEDSRDMFDALSGLSTIIRTLMKTSFVVIYNITLPWLVVGIFYIFLNHNN